MIKKGIYKNGVLVTINNRVYRVKRNLNKCDAFRDNHGLCQCCNNLKKRLAGSMLERVKSQCRGLLGLA